MKGQIVVIFLLIMVVALAIALSLVGRTIVEISNSTDSESSSRAFSAAEAGIEKAIKDYNTIGAGGSTEEKSVSIQNDLLTNKSTAEVSLKQGLPKATVALEYPPFGKESFAQFWLAKPSDLSAFYTADSFDIYFGTPMDYAAIPQEQPAISIQSIYLTSLGYKSKQLYFDSYTIGDDTTPSARNDSFKACLERNIAGIFITTNENLSALSGFYCRVRVQNYKDSGSTPIMLRIRFHYTSSAHPLAIQPLLGSSLPPQVNVYDSTGVSGNVQRNIKVFRQENVLPFFFDYVLFSAGDLTK